MSANNYILIKQTDNGYTVCIKSLSGKGTYNQRSFKDILKAIKYAIRLENDEYIEYGIKFLLNEDEE